MRFIQPDENECHVWFFSAEDLPDGLSIDACTGKITGTLTRAGIFNVKVNVDDGHDSASMMFVWKVEECAAPASVIVNPGDRRNKTGDEVVLQIEAQDAEDEVLTFKADGLPDGLLIDTNLGKIMGRPSKAGHFPVKITVSDGISSVSVHFNWIVDKRTGTGKLPLIVNPGDQINQVGDKVAL